MHELIELNFKSCITTFLAAIYMPASTVEYDPLIKKFSDSHPNSACIDKGHM